MKILLAFIVLGILAFNPGVSQAKGGDDQDQIILLNDSASALEDSNPGLSKSLTQFADEKEKEWEDKNANKNGLQKPIIDKNIQYRIKLLRAAALAIGPIYPLIAKGLNKMANDINHPEHPSLPKEH
jgi:hypothetical protein